MADFSRQWVDEAPEWHTGYSQHPLPLPTTNNACESSVGKTRDEAGSVETGALPVAKFMLTQVEFFSKRPYDPAKARSIGSDVWERAAAFRALIGTDKVRPVRRGGKVFHVSWGRGGDGRGAEVADRPAMHESDASRLVDVHLRLSSGADTSYEALAEFRQARVTWHGGGATSCTCPAFVSSLSLTCFHGLAVDMAAGRTEAPPEQDRTRLMAAGVARAGRRPTVGDCYAVQAHPGEPAAEGIGDVGELLGGYKPGGRHEAAPLPRARGARRPPAAPRAALQGPPSAPPTAPRGPPARLAGKRPAAAEPEGMSIPSAARDHTLGSISP